MLLVEHDVEMVFGLSERVYVLDFGELIAEGTPQQVQSDPRVRTAYLGEVRPAVAEVTTVVADKPVPAHRDELIRVEGLLVRYGNATAIEDVSFQAFQGSVSALLGANGAGKSTIARALCGLIPTQAGTIAFDGHVVSGLRPNVIRRMGLAYLPEGRGIFPTLTVSENLRVAVQSIPKSERAAAIERAISLARVLASPPRLIIADEISLGLAPLVVDDVFAGLERAVDMGVSVILIEQFVHRALELADDCHILRRGRIVWSGAATQAGPEVLDNYLSSEADPAERALTASQEPVRAGEVELKA
jgi:branched-chain amino acid transport system ATP-binding protein